MGIIDVTLEKPAFKRKENAETVEEETVETEQRDTSPGRGRTFIKAAGLLGTAVVGVLFLRKVRTWRTDR